MRVSELKRAVESTGSYFFSRDSMKFFGDIMSNYGVTSAVINTRSAENVDVWSLNRKRAVKMGLSDSTYFNKKTFEKEYRV